MRNAPVSRGIRLVGLVCLAVLLPGRSLSEGGAGAWDPHYPDMEHWARAGVRDGVPADSSPVAVVQPGGDIQAAIDEAAANGGGWVRLAAGEHMVERTIHLRSGIVLCGDPDAATVLHLKMRGRFARERGDDGFSEWTCGISARDVRGAGLLRLQLVFDRSLPPPPTLRTHKESFINDPEGRDDLWVVSVRFANCDDCWMRDCRIINSGTHPVLIEGSRHLTVEDCVVDGAHNKGGRGAGYFNLTRSEYVLVRNVAVRDIRHVAIQNASEGFPCRYNVLVDCHFAVDLNFHNGDSGHNLVQDCVIAVPPWHWWAPIGAGVPGQHEPPGPGNLVFRCRLSRTYPDPSRNYTMGEDPLVVYAVRDHFEKGVPMLREAGPAPEGGTLYVRP